MDDEQVKQIQARVIQSRTLEEMLAHTTSLANRVKYLIYTRNQAGATSLVGPDHPMFQPPNFLNQESGQDLFNRHFC